jgi:hypothetical protein
MVIVAAVSLSVLLGLGVIWREVRRLQNAVDALQWSRERLSDLPGINDSPE